MVSRRCEAKRLGRVIVAMACVLAPSMVAARAQELDESWTVSVNGQTVQVDPDGRFVIPNIPAPDQFGPDGPGTPPDFLSDDFLRVVGFSTADGVTRWVHSPLFQISQGESFNVEDLIFTATPLRFPNRFVFRQMQTNSSSARRLN